MKISQEEIRNKLINSAKQFISAEEANYMADETIEAFLRKTPRTNPLKSTIDDLSAIKLARDVATKIEASLKYPGTIKVNVIRETRAEEYAK